jgi:hypothetical protein
MASALDENRMVTGGGIPASCPPHDLAPNFMLEIGAQRFYIGITLYNSEAVLDSMGVIRTEQSRARPVGQLQLILTLIGWGVGLVALLSNNLTSIALWARFTIIGFICLSFGVSLVLGIFRVSRLVMSWVDSARKTTQQQRSLMQLTEIVQETRALLDPHISYSLPHYLDLLCNALVHNETMHPQIERLSERLRILSDWHWTLLTFADSGFKQKMLFTRRVRGITMFYRDLADIVRELASTRLPADASIMAHDDQRRIVKEKYNQHIGRLEQVLEAIGKVNPEIQTGSFHRL